MILSELSLLFATLVYSVLAVVFRWFVGVLISKVFFLALRGPNGDDAHSITFEGHLKVLFLESWSFYEIVWALTIASVLLALSRGLRSFLNTKIVVEDSVRMRARLFDAMLDFERNSSGLQDTMMQKLEIVEGYRLSLENERLMDIIIFASSVVLLITFSWRSFLLVITLVTIQKVWVVVFDIPVLSALRKEFQSKQSQVVSRMTDAARVRELVQVHDRQEEEARAIHSLEQEALDVNHRIAWRGFLMQFIPQCLNMATMPAVCLLSYELMKDLHGPRAVSEGVSLLLVMFTLQEVHRALSEIIVIEESKIVHDAAAADIRTFLSARPPPSSSAEAATESETTTSARSIQASAERSGMSGSIVVITDLPSPLPPPKASSGSSPAPRGTVSGLAPSLSLSGVCFQYSGASKPALLDATVTFEAGVSHAVMGESGGGKSTLLKLLQGLLRPTEGEVRVDGQPLGRVLGAYRERLGVVSQDSLLFARSLRDNLTYGLHPDDPRAAPDCVERALRTACLEEVVASLPDGVDTVLTQGEGQLSGGQRQRVHLARLFVRDPEIVLLDEPTSALDSATCNKVVASLQRFLPGKTAVIVSHHREAVVDRLCSVVHHVEAVCGAARSVPPSPQAIPGPTPRSMGGLAVLSLRGSFQWKETLKNNDMAARRELEEVGDQMSTIQSV